MILGVDFSLTATGVCAITDGEAECATFTSKATEWWSFGERPREIAAALTRWHSEGRPAWVIESPSYMSKGRGHDKVLVGWHMFVDHMIHELGYNPPLLVAPSQLKKFILGKGGGTGTTKFEVGQAVTRRYPDVVVNGPDEADALVLAAIGAAAYGEPFTRTLAKYQQEVVDAVRAGKEAL